MKPRHLSNISPSFSSTPGDTFIAISARWKWLELAMNPATAAAAVTAAAPQSARAPLLLRPAADLPAVPWDMNRTLVPLEDHLGPVSKVNECL